MDCSVAEAALGSACAKFRIIGLRVAGGGVAAPATGLRGAMVAGLRGAMVVQLLCAVPPLRQRDGRERKYCIANRFSSPCLRLSQECKPRRPRRTASLHSCSATILPSAATAVPSSAHTLSRRLYIRSYLANRVSSSASWPEGSPPPLLDSPAVLRHHKPTAPLTLRIAAVRRQLNNCWAAWQREALVT